MVAVSACGLDRVGRVCAGSGRIGGGGSGAGTAEQDDAVGSGVSVARRAEKSVAVIIFQ